ncbi:hypothetical protein [Mesorhizobium sp. M0847]|uniref:hypothetical protein n=1 Tax=unclassified Mesorhizobium TaxID=325217 RepID=UPI00333CE37F
MQRDLQLGVHVADSTSITTKEASKLWLERCDAEGLERSTRDAYAQHVNIHIVPLIGARKLSQFNTPHAHAFADELAKDRSLAMVKRVVRSLGAIFVEAGGVAWRRQSAVGRQGEDERSAKVEAARDPDQTRVADDTGRRPRQAPRPDSQALFSGLRASELRASDGTPST